MGFVGANILEVMFRSYVRGAVGATGAIGAVGIVGVASTFCIALGVVGVVGTRGVCGTIPCGIPFCCIPPGIPPLAIHWGICGI